jgi:uncharacterized protein
MAIVALAVQPFRPALAQDHDSTPASPAAQSVEKIWYGVLDLQVSQLRIVFRQSVGDEGQLKAQAFSLDQGNAEMKVKSFVIADGKLSIEMPGIVASFSGTLNEDETEAVGEFTQGGRARPFSLRVVDEIPTLNPDEIWTGTLVAGPRKLKLQFRVFDSGKPTENVMFDSLNEGVTGLVAARKVEGGEVTIKMAGVGASFSGTLNDAGDELVGEWSQGGAELPFALKKTDPADAASLKPKRPQTPQPPFPYESIDVTFENNADGVTLAGTLTLPAKDGKFPVAVMISGSGPQDRDETLFDHKLFLVIADDLARRGIAVLRFDDRGVGESTGNFGTATSEDFSRDAEAALNWLKAHPAIDPDRIGLLGHSEGGLIAPMIAARNNKVAFAILLAGTGVDGSQIALNQTRAMSLAEGLPEATAEAQVRMVAAAIDEARKAEDPVPFRERAVEALKTIATIEAEEAGANLEDAQAEAIANAIVDRFDNPWMKFFLIHDPAGQLKKTHCPVLVLNGEKDTQVDPKLNLPAIETALKAGGNTQFRVVELPGLNHLFQDCESGGMSEYNNIEQTIAPLALNTIGEWLEATILKR